MQVSLVANQNPTKGAGIAIVQSGHTTAWHRTLFLRLLQVNAMQWISITRNARENNIVRSGHTNVHLLGIYSTYVILINQHFNKNTIFLYSTLFYIPHHGFVCVSLFWQVDEINGRLWVFRIPDSHTTTWGGSPDSSLSPIVSQCSGTFTLKPQSL